MKRISRTGFGLLALVWFGCGTTALEEEGASAEQPLSGPAPLAAWSFDEGAGTVAKDAVTQRVATLTGGVNWTAGKVGSALAFDGATGCARVADAPDLDLGPGRDFSYAFWMRPTSLTSTGFVLSKGGGGTTDVGYAFIVSNGRPWATLSKAGESLRRSATGPVLTPGWHHVAVTHARKGAMTVYVDGAPVASTSIADYDADLGNAQPLAFGCYSRGGGYYAGGIDDVRLFSRALTATEVAAVAGSSPTAETPPTTNSPPPCNAPSPTLPFDGAYYGTSVNGGGLGNTRHSRYHSHRFRAELTGNVLRTRWISPRKTGYITGNGGTIQVVIHPDDGAGNPNLGSRICATATYASAATNPALGDFPDVPFASPCALTRGAVYHLVHYQLAPDQGTSSVDDLWSASSARPRSAWPYEGDTLASMMYSSGSWIIRPEATPIFEIDYEGGITKGQGYGMGGATDARLIGGTSVARERIVPPRSLRAREVTLRVWREGSGAGDLRFSIRDAAGAVLGGAAIARSQVPTSTCECFSGTSSAPLRWTTVALDREIALAAGSTYYLVLDAPSGAGYKIAGSYKGLSEGFREDKMRRGDRAEFSTNGGSSFSGWSLWGVTNRNDVDLPILLRTDGCTSTP